MFLLHLSNDLIPPCCSIFQEMPFKNFPLLFLKRSPLYVVNPASARYNSNSYLPFLTTIFHCVLSLLQQDIPMNELGDYHHNLTPIRIKYQEVTGIVCRWQDHRIYIKGWASFCRRNKIERNDTCFCEVISGEDQVVKTLRVHVARRR